VAVAVALTEMVRLLIQGNIAGAVLVGVTGLVLVVLGAMTEQRLRGALRNMS
jgi:integral membrane sensor domain MASE1